MRIAVLGRGLIGSAAARHLARAGHEVVLIGPEEPGDKRGHRGVFASHYDEGRITRRIATRRFWAEVSSASIDRYAEIAAEGGIAFFTETGAMMAGPADGPLVGNARAVREALGLAAEDLDRAALTERFPFFAFPEGFAALYEPRAAGHISPRRLVAAQTAAARGHGAEILDAEVLGIEESDAGVRIATPTGTVTADRALIATGGMTDHILPRPLGLKVLARTVVFFEVDAAQAARLAAMPSLVFRWDDRSEPYLLPPIRYPDGRILVKLGGDPVDVPLTSPQEIGDWFRSGGDAEVAAYLREMFAGLMPGVAVGASHHEPCMTTYTESGLPIIGPLSLHLAVATAGNGAGAKCSDELGRLGAEAVLGRSRPDLAPPQMEGVSR